MAFLNANIRLFIDCGLAAAKSKIRCGFELETQSTNGHRQGGPRIPDAALFDRAALDHTTDRIDPFSFLSANLFDQLHSETLAYYRRTLSPSNYGRSPLDHMRQTIDSNLLEAGTDGSVAGFEFRTIGGLTYFQFLGEANRLFRHTHVIDEKCSYHIHLSLPGVRHRYGKRFQAAMIEYVCSQWDRFPSGLKSRLKKITDMTYFKKLITNGTDKYAFIRFHPEYGTWEFRCFGNIQTAAEAKTCLDIAIEAMKHAYSVLDGQREMISSELWDSATNGLWTDFILNTLSVGKPVTRQRAGSFLNLYNKRTA